MGDEFGDDRFISTGLPGDGVSVIVVTYRSSGHLEECVAALRRAVSGLAAELIIVDNDSGDGTAEAARKLAPDARVVESGWNGGFAYGCHAGVTRAQGQWLVFVNPDAFPAPGSIGALIDCARAEPKAGIVGGRCVGADGMADPRSWWGRPGLWSAFCFASLLSSVFPGNRFFDPESPRPWSAEVREVPVVTGGFMLVTREAWDRTGGFDEAFFMYGEDADVCLRARKLGYRPMVTGRAVFRHEGGGSSTSADKLMLLFIGKATVMRRHVGRGAVRLLVLGVFVRAALSRLLSARPERQGRPTAKGEDWRTLWTRRREWAKGWSS